MQKFGPVVNSPRHNYLMFEYNEKYNSPSLEFPIGNAGKRGEIKMGANAVPVHVDNYSPYTRENCAFYRQSMLLPTTPVGEWTGRLERSWI